MNKTNRKISQPALLLPMILLLSITPGITFAGGTTEVEIIEVDVEITDQLAHGEEAHKNHCYKCHTDSVYTRDDRFVKSIDALSKQVVRCKDGSNIPWFDEDSDAVVQFLNKKYYRF
jgi:hypothetical protein